MAAWFEFGYLEAALFHDVVKKRLLESALAQRMAAWVELGYLETALFRDVVKSAY